MKLPKILRILKEEPLLITPGAHASLVKLFDDHSSLSAEQFQAAREGTGPCGEQVELDQMEIEDGIAYIPIGGPIGQGLGAFEKGAGAVDVEDISDDIDTAVSDPQVRAIVFDIDSPGGMVSGTPELAEKIKAIEKDTYTFTKGQMASAAYWLASACDQIFCTPSADIGSIGVYLPWADFTEFYQSKGIKIELFKSGKYKGMGYIGTSLTKDQKAFLQDRVNSIAESFYTHVQSMRDGVTSETMQGQSFMGMDAYKFGLVDEVFGSRREAMETI